MKYEKQALTFEAQADRLISRGLVADRSELIMRLGAVSYYRLTGYLHNFRLDESDNYRAGTALKTIWDRYCFDRRLRVLALDVIERVEVSVRTKLIYLFAEAHGPFGHLEPRNLPKMDIDDYLEWRTNLSKETGRSKQAFKTRFLNRYGDCHQELPLWMLAELMSMGSMLTFFKGVSPEIKRKVAEEYGLADELFHSWLRSLNAVRNMCAHHARLWNSELGYQPLLPQPNKYPEWHGENKLSNSRCGIILMICRHLIALITPSSQWTKRVEALFAEYPEIPLRDMGLPEQWTKHPVWLNESRRKSRD